MEMELAIEEQRDRKPKSMTTKRTKETRRTRSHTKKVCHMSWEIITASAIWRMLFRESMLRFWIHLKA